MAMFDRSANRVAPELRNAGIYCITNTVIGRVYVGQTRREIWSRWLLHRRDLRKRRHENKSLQQDWDYFGEQVFVISALENHSWNVSQELLTEREWFYIDSLPGEKYNVLRLRPGDLFDRNIPDSAK